MNINEFKNQLCSKNEKVSLYYAELKDKRLIYDMSMEPEIKSIMFGGKNEPHNWEEYKDIENEFYTGAACLNNYLLIEFESQIVGAISHSYNESKINNMELDIWLRSISFLGKGIGVSALNLLMNYLTDTYGIKTFIIRPWIKNPGAIKAYQKAGFRIVNNFSPTDYYGDDVGEWGDGDYGASETVNMVRTVE